MLGKKKNTKTRKNLKEYHFKSGDTENLLHAKHSAGASLSHFMLTVTLHGGAGPSSQIQSW